MAIPYSVAEMKNPQKPQEKAKFYAKVQVREEIPLTQIADEVSWGSSLTSGEIMNLVQSASEKIGSHLRAGDMVDMGEFGKFQIQLASKGADTRKAFTHHNIKKVRIQFRPGKLIRKALQDIRFEHVMTRQSQKEARRRETAQQPEEAEG